MRINDLSLGALIVKERAGRDEDKLTLATHHQQLTKRRQARNNLQDRREAAAATKEVWQ